MKTFIRNYFYTDIFKRRKKKKKKKKKKNTYFGKHELLQFIILPVALAYCLSALPAISISPSCIISRRCCVTESGECRGELAEVGERGETLLSGDGNRCPGGDAAWKCSARRDKSTWRDILNDIFSYVNQTLNYKIIKIYNIFPEKKGPNPQSTHL